MWEEAGLPPPGRMGPRISGPRRNGRSGLRMSPPLGFGGGVNDGAFPNLEGRWRGTPGSGRWWMDVLKERPGRSNDRDREEVAPRRPAPRPASSGMKHLRVCEGRECGGAPRISPNISFGETRSSPFGVYPKRNGLARGHRPDCRRDRVERQATRPLRENPALKTRLTEFHGSGRRVTRDDRRVR